LVLPAKIFEIRGEQPLDELVDDLRVFREEEPFQIDEGQRGNLVTEIFDIEDTENLVSGVFSKDFLREHYYRGGSIQVPTTEEAPFWITQQEDRHMLIVIAPSVARGVRKLLSTHVANRISEILFGEIGSIVEVRIPHETLRRLHESNPQATNLIWFDGVDIPGVDKLCLSGTSLADTELYHQYLEHGQIWYVVFEAQEYGVVVGIARSAVVTLFSKSTTEDFIAYITESLLALIE